MEMAAPLVLERSRPRVRDFDKVTHSLGKRLRRLRAARGWTQRVAALRIGVGTPLVRRLENGQANPSLAILLSVADAFGIPLKDLLAR